ncbi:MULTISPECIES: pentapeptide repeat-containing protein [unclassified Amycolatopsis]|uniref:pentapeptide repeat-containing protein n=1 Tax=unclassified Amycolatopsis TaxID=2618356 RepID=UPI0028753F5F|nr:MULTISPECIES: pentapeptide repeat-containing protein [unclassified Amycolatopsis]MDS0137480.1 pentapeptide repeat-containing protein [Amycolatopsis sp. 505]MDS0141675.1 pentapeptide repeat-containing protein [Amycolatopsis sp. CM201R]
MGNQLERVLRTRTIVLWSAGLLTVAALAATLLLTLLGGGRPEDSARLDALKTAANIVVGTGGAAALLLAARRQRSAELELVQKDHDATERRITEMYGKAADQLGSDKAPVRLAGLYALERLAAGHPEHRQTIVNVFCAYLRMPHGPGKDAEELQVRKAAQRILMLHLRPGRAEQPSGDFWPDTDLDFSGAELVGLTLTHCSIRSIVCYETKFLGLASFRGTEFRTKADFNKAEFADRVDFRGTVFGGERESFNGAVFAGPADFGTKSAARLAGARAKPGFPRTWPPGWEERPIAGQAGQVELTRKDEPGQPAAR